MCKGNKSSIYSDSLLSVVFQDSQVVDEEKKNFIEEL